MISPKILERFGCTRSRLREIFEKVPREMPTGRNATEEEKQKYRDYLADEKVRIAMEAEISANFQESVAWGLKNYQFFAAADVAWDTPSVTKEMIPLLLFAQGKINIQACSNQLSALGCSDQFVRKDAAGSPIAVDMPKFVETSINMVRSYITRRHAAQSVKYSNLYPYYKYESRSTGQVGKLRADVMSQEAEVMVDGFGYRHHDSQVMRDAFLYGHSIDFVRCAWECYRQYEVDPKDPAFVNYESGDPKDLPVRDYITKEGLSWINPHPTRLILDNSEPISAINDDVGPKWIGYWDVVRYADVANNPMYFNRNAITYGQGLWQLYTQYTPYFSQYFCNITPPPSAFSPTPVPDSCAPTSASPASVADPGGANDRRSNIALYGSDVPQAAMFKCEYFRKLIPADHRMGSYPFPIWIRFVVASDSTVIFAEPLPSAPAAYLGINQADGRQINPSMAHDALWIQDLLSNLITQLMLAVEGELFKVLGINQDLVPPEEIKKIMDRLSGRDWSARGPLVIPFSVKQVADELDIKLDAVFKLGETRQGQSVEVIFKAMTQVVAIFERLTALSPAEQGQPAPREISATEVVQISSTTQNVYDFISDAIDEYRAAKKRIIYESACCCKEGKVEVPVVSRYSRKTIQAAGFAIQDETREDETNRPQRVTLVGSKQYLRHDLVFSSRDGAERPVNTQGANTLTQLMQVVLQVPPVLEAIGKEKIYEIFNEIFRLSGTGVDLNLELQEGDGQTFGEDEIQKMGQTLQALQQAMQQMAGQIQQSAQELQQQEAVNAKQEDMLKGLMDAARVMQRSAMDINSLHNRVDALDKKPKPIDIPYTDAPEEVRRQLEARAGYTAPQQPTYLEEKIALETKRNGAPK